MEGGFIVSLQLFPKRTASKSKKQRRQGQKIRSDTLNAPSGVRQWYMADLEEST